MLESVDFPLSITGTAALEQMESVALASGLEVRILRFGWLWGPFTGHNEHPGDPGWLHVDDAARALLEAVVQLA